MGASRLGLYNEALRLLGERRLASLTEARDHRYHLDDAYDRVVAYCLEQGFWNFAMRSLQIDASGSIAPQFGFTYAFQKPDDWVRTYIISPTECLDLWPSRFNDEAGIWYAEVNPLWARYISNDPAYGMNLGNWPETFGNYVSCRLALQTCPSISSGSSEKLDMIAKAERRAKIDARAKDAMNEPPGFPPMGTWAQSRLNGWRRPRSSAGGMTF